MTRTIWLLAVFLAIQAAQATGTKQTDLKGVDTGNQHTFTAGTDIETRAFDLQKIHVYTANGYVYALKFGFKVPGTKVTDQSPIYGNSAVSPDSNSPFSVSEGDKIVQVEVWWSSQIDGVKVKTKRNKNQEFGSLSNSNHIFSFAQDQLICGINMRFGSSAIYKLGFILRQPDPTAASTSNSSSTLSTGAIIGIAVGVSVVFVAVLAAIIVKKCEEPQQPQQHADPQPQVPETQQSLEAIPQADTPPVKQ